MTTASTTRAPRGRRSARPSGDDREQAILATALRLLEGRPFAEISVDDLAKGAGLSRPTFYFYFASKEALLLSLIEPLIKFADTGFDGVADLPADPRRAFHEGIRRFFTPFAEHPVIARAGLEAIATIPEVRATWSHFMQKWIHQTRDLIVAERQRGAAPDTIPALELATTLNLMNERTMTAVVSDEGNALPHDAVVDTLAHIWLASIYGAGS